MADPASAPLSSIASNGPRAPLRSTGETWFRSRDGRRYAWELGAIIVVKLALLVLLWFVFIKPWPRQPAAPQITVQQLYMPTAPPARHD
jgi:hypothetical protein